ncbi:MAG: EamA family transporter [Candidatus Eisenbacteria bacterium]
MSWLPWALGSAVFAGLTAILAKVGVRDVDSDFATAIRTTVILLFAWSWAAMRGVVTPQIVSGRTWLFLVLSGLATGASWLCYFHALKLGEASRVAPVDKLSVVIAVVLAALFLNEKMTAAHVVGVALIVAGSIVLARA